MWDDNLIGVYVCVAPLLDLPTITCSTNMGRKVKRLVTQLCKGMSGRHLEHSTSSPWKACKSSSNGKVKIGTSL